MELVTDGVQGKASTPITLLLLFYEDIDVEASINEYVQYFFFHFFVIIVDLFIRFST